MTALLPARIFMPESGTDGAEQAAAPRCELEANGFSITQPAS
jgi:hypothetical protein